MKWNHQYVKRLNEHPLWCIKWKSTLTIPRLVSHVLLLMDRASIHLGSFLIIKTNSHNLFIIIICELAARPVSSSRSLHIFYHSTTLIIAIVFIERIRFDFRLETEMMRLKRGNVWKKKKTGILVSCAGYMVYLWTKRGANPFAVIYISQSLTFLGAFIYTFDFLKITNAWWKCYVLI